ncbi:MAG: hypothetical protein CHACPFDD_03634 [Phycisphaerae bacterium]|nr:hypothetical protein [Phycisphaerae bacterium]
MRKYLSPRVAARLPVTAPTNRRCPDRFSCQDASADRFRRLPLSSHPARPSPRRAPSYLALSFLPALLTGAAQPDQDPTAPTTPHDRPAQISAYVRRIFQDRAGNLWFGTNDDGVCRHDGKSLDYFSVEQGLAGRAVRGIVQDRAGALWFATDGGVSRYQGGKFTNYATAHGLSDNNVWSMLLDRAGTIWVGTQAGVFRLEGQSFAPFPIPRAEVEHPSSQFSPNLVWTMFEDAAGNVWFGTDGEGARKFDGKSFTTYTTKDGLAGDNVRCILGDRRGRIWFASATSGVTSYDGRAFRTFAEKDGLSPGGVWTMFEDHAGNLWFSTLGAGVCRYDGKSFTPFREDGGLTRNHVQSILEDRDGTLWFGFSGGLFRFDGKSFINVTRTGPWPAPLRAPTPPASPTP